MEEIKRTLGQTPPELAADIWSGNRDDWRRLPPQGFPKLIAKETGVPVILAENPLLCVANGAGRYFEQMREMGSSKTIYNNLTT